MRAASPRRSGSGQRAPTPPPFRAESPRVGDEQGSVTQSSPLLRANTPQGPETYTLFRPEEVLSSAKSAKIRRIEEDMVNVRLDDIYNALTLPWQIDRKDINDAHGTEWEPELAPDFWASSDTGKVCFAALPSAGHALSKAGQYQKSVGSDWCHFPDTSAAPGNKGGFHGCCIDTLQPGSEWTLVAKLADFGLALGRHAGLRTEFAALVRNDCEALIASLGSHDECRSLFLVDQLMLNTGCVVVMDPAELSAQEAAPDAADGIVAPAGLGAGYYPVFVSRDERDLICRITVVFHSSRAQKICRRFPPVPQTKACSKSCAHAELS